MKERPILFSGPMVRAILEGRKTMTRRLWKLPKWAEWDCTRGGEKSGSLIPKNPADGGWHSVDEVACPYGQPGDRLWVRETWCCVHGVPSAGSVPHPDDFVRYRADNGPGEQVITDVRSWHPSIHMPRVYSRILLEITGVRVERLHEISEADAQAEGVERVVVGSGWRRYCDPDSEEVGVPPCGDARRSFRSLWKFINGAESWNANPWVWVVEFKRVQP